MNVAGMALGCILIALGLMMAANQGRYVYFVIGPSSVLVVAGVVAMLIFWILLAAKQRPIRLSASAAHAAP
jgi:predicted permease